MVEDAAGGVQAGAELAPADASPRCALEGGEVGLGDRRQRPAGLKQQAHQDPACRGRRGPLGVAEIDGGRHEPFHVDPMPGGRQFLPARIRRGGDQPVVAGVQVVTDDQPVDDHPQVAVQLQAGLERLCGPGGGVRPAGQEPASSLRIGLPGGVPPGHVADRGKCRLAITENVGAVECLGGLWVMVGQSAVITSSCASSSVIATGSAQLGHSPPRPILRMKVAQSGHRCSPTARVPQRSHS